MLRRLSIEEEKENRRLCNYRLEAEVPAKEMTSMFEEFKADFKARRFCYPGYRCVAMYDGHCADALLDSVGVVPPNAMSDVYPFIVKSSVQYAVGQACEDNYIIPVDSETADEADMGDEYLSSILLGTDLTDLTSTWLPGKRLEFNVEFTGVEGDKWDGEEGEDEDEENEGNNENGDNEIQDEGVITDLEQAEVEKPSTPNKE
jgi:hypothetical protein